MIVLDASAAIELVLNSATGRQVSDRIADERETIHVPHLIDIELIHVIRRYVQRSVINQERGETAIRSWRMLDLHRYEHEPFLDRIWQLRDNFSAYDAAYIALAETLSVPVITADRHLAGAAIRVPIEVY